MPGGPLIPTSALPYTAGKVFSGFHSGGTSGPTQLGEGLRVMASLDGDAFWTLYWENIPATLPTGTLKLRLLARATNDTAGALVAKVNPGWSSVAIGEDPSATTINYEGTQTVSWAASGADNNEYKELLVTLDADTLVGGEILSMALKFETSGWTLDSISTWIPALVWA